MPLYEFFCPTCKEVKEELQKYEDPPPNCDKHNIPMKRQLSVTKGRKGGGLYSLDVSGGGSWGDLE